MKSAIQKKKKLYSETVAWASTACLALGAVHFSTQSAYAQAVPDIQRESLDQERRAAQRQEQQKQQQSTARDVFLTDAPTKKSPRLPEAESPCFEVQTLVFQSNDAEQFDWLIAHADGHTLLAPADPAQGKCLGAQGIQTVIDRLQNALIERGFVTSRVLATPQNLQAGTLTLTIATGRVNGLRWSEGTNTTISQWNAVPARQGDVLNLRDIEQALENLKRVPTAEADIQIAPAREPGYSDLVISYQQAKTWRLALGMDDSGLRNTGKYLGNFTYSLDNPLGLSDLFYTTINHGLGGADAGPRGTHGVIVHYSVPFRYWTWAATLSTNRYHQTVAGANQDYLYSGTSQTLDFKLSHIVQRDSAGKTTASLKAFQRRSNNYIDDTEVQAQQRIVSGLEATLGHRRMIGATTVEGSLTYRQGIGAWGALPAPEEAFDEGTSRMKLVLADLSLTHPFKLWGQDSSYALALRGQNNQTPLTPQDRFAIGGRYTVRGFDGINVLSAEKGWLVRNDLTLSLSPTLQTYIGLDSGHVSGPSAANLVGKNLSGAVMGAKGTLWQKLQYDIFVGQALRKPQQFKTASTSAGFSLYLAY